jgi:hypothetical protein
LPQQLRDFARVGCHNIPTPSEAPIISSTSIELRVE